MVKYDLVFKLTVVRTYFAGESEVHFSSCFSRLNEYPQPTSNKKHPEVRLFFA